MTRAWLLVAAVTACSRGGAAGAPAPDPAHPPMSAAEKERATALCAGYARRVCACAEHDAALRETCDLARGEPEAVRMHLDVLAGAPLAAVTPAGKVKASAARRRAPLNDRERRLTEASLRKVVAACVKLDAALDPARCPRP